MPIRFKQGRWKTCAWSLGPNADGPRPMDNSMMVRGLSFADPNGASQAPSETPMDLTKRSRDQPQDLRVRTNGAGHTNATPSHKRERLESMVNHIRQCSTVQSQRRDVETDCLRARLNAPPVRMDNGTPDTSDSDNSDNESAWRPEDIFFLSANAQTPGVQDFRIRRESGSSAPSSSTAGAGSDQWRCVDAKTALWHRAYFPWMAYYAQLVRTEMTKEENGSDDSSRQRLTATPASSGSPPPNPVTTSGRKRAPRALTGKHVKHGTGASPSTLMTLRQKIEQRQKSQQNKPESRGKKRKNNL